MKIFSYSKWRLGKDWGLWFRFFGKGFSISTYRPCFSERNGYTKYWQIGKVKIAVLK